MSLTPIVLQFKCAHALAAAHGHEWATTLSKAEVVHLVEGLESASQAAAAIARKVAAAPDRNLMPGIDRPAVDEFGDISHTTGSRRLTWLVGDDGRVGIRLERRALRFLEALTDPHREGVETVEEYPGVEDAVREGRYDEGFDVLHLRLNPDGMAHFESLTMKALDPAHLDALRAALNALSATGHRALGGALVLLKGLEDELGGYGRFWTARAAAETRAHQERARDPHLPLELREQALLAASGVTREDLKPTQWYRHVGRDGVVRYGSTRGGVDWYPEGALVASDDAVRSHLPEGWLTGPNPLAAWHSAIERAVLSR